MSNYNTCSVVDDPVVLSIFTTVCKGGVYLPIIVFDLSKVTYLQKYQNEVKSILLGM